MDFRLNEEQQLLRDSVQRFVRDGYDFDRRNTIVASDAGTSRDTWARFADMGWLALPFADYDGGLDGGGIETMVLMEAFGGALVVEPYLASVLLGGRTVALAGSDAQKDALLAPMIAGEHLLALAVHERAGRYDPTWVDTRAARAGGRWRLDGTKALVLHGDVADVIIVAARTAGAPGDADGLTLFAVPVGTSGITRQPVHTIDGMRACELALDHVEVDDAAVLGEQGGALAVIERVHDEAVAAVCAEAVGAMDALLALTADYLRQRRQFGQPLAAFQVLQHRVADMSMALEKARSLAIMAALHVAHDEPAERARAVSAAKVQAGRAGRFVGQHAVQLHGGIGISDELAAAHYFKRLTAIEYQLGSTDWHLRRFGALQAARA